MNLGTLDVQNVNRKSFSPTHTYILLDYGPVCYWCLAFEALTDESDCLDRRPLLQRVRTSDLPGPGAVDVQYGENTPSLPSSLSSDATTVNRWATPPSRFRSPASSFQHPRESTEEPLIRAARTSASLDRHNGPIR
jgi:hypothetical protein